jgi:hypothetical protein
MWLIKMVDAPEYFFTNNEDISVTSWPESNIKTVFHRFNNDESNEKNYNTLF